jgi:hypothetical protein
MCPAKTAGKWDRFPHRGQARPKGVDLSLLHGGWPVIAFVAALKFPEGGASIRCFHLEIVCCFAW